MDKIYIKGELLQIHTINDGIFEGRYHGINCDKTKLSLYNVKELPEGNTNEGICHYYNSEVRNIVKIKDPDELLANNFKKNVNLSQKECEEITMYTKKYIFINQVDNTYHEALDDLNQFGFIAVGTDGSEMGRKYKLPFLTLSTPHQIYIFDIQVMQFHAFDGGLKKLLEADYPKKIIHNCRKISDSLFHKHNVKMNSVFDTQVGDIIITKNKIGQFPKQVKSLQECMALYLGLPASTFEEKLNFTDCTKRPLSVTVKESLAKNIAYIHRLSEVINEELLLPFVRGVDCYVESIRSCDDFKAWQLCGQDNQLPKDFKNAIEY